MKKNYDLIKNLIQLLENFEGENTSNSCYTLDDFLSWVIKDRYDTNTLVTHEPDWEGKTNNRTPESVISTLLVHMSRYAKSYSKAAMLGTDFTTQEDFIFLISLKAFGKLTKMELIKKNVQEKSVGIQIINRLLKNGWVGEEESLKDKRSTYLFITGKGSQALESIMDNVRLASNIVSGDLEHAEKLELIRLLTKLNDFHQAIYNENIKPDNLLSEANNALMNK